MNLNFDSGFLIIADISGYTSYVAKTELQDAQALLAELLTRIVEKFEPVVKISRLEGDAVFAYSSAAMPLNGATLMELIESTYIAFREGQELYRRTLCDCEACQSLPMLELKFIVHHGEYAVQKVGNYRELIGSDVNLAHRLLKNHAVEATGLQAYALITESALTQINLPLDDARQQTETYDHLGEINTHVVDLTPHYQAWAESRRVVVTSQEADLTMNATTDLPRMMFGTISTTHPIGSNGKAFSAWNSLMDGPPSEGKTCAWTEAGHLLKFCWIGNRLITTLLQGFCLMEVRKDLAFRP